MSNTNFKLNYKGSFGWLIFWLVIFFPIAIVLLLTASSFKVNNKIYNLTYGGSRGWLCFWFVVFFPIAIVLLFINGFSITKEDLNSQEDIIEVKVDKVHPKN